MRQSRWKRRPRVRVRLGERDRVLFTALARFQMARTTDLLTLAFPGIRRDTAAARLRRLYDASYLNILGGSLNEENVYVLAPEGRTWAAAQGFSLPRRARGNREHHLAVVRAWASLAASCHQLGLGLASFRPDWEIARTSLAVPDAIVKIVRDGSLVHLALEIDLGTESRRTLQAKVKALAREVQSGAFPSKIGLVVAQHGRADLFHSILDKNWPSWSLIWDMAEPLIPVLKRLPLPAPTAVRGGQPSQVTQSHETPSDLSLLIRRMEKVLQPRTAKQDSSNTHAKEN